jgi:hypothetical protein
MAILGKIKKRSKMGIKMDRIGIKRLKIGLDRFF